MTQTSYSRSEAGLYIPSYKTFELKPIRKAPEYPELIKWLPRWQSNNSPEDLGIVRFGFELFPQTLNKEYGLARWVRSALYKVLSYYPHHTKVDRCYALCTYREGSKSTWFGKILPLYFMLMGQYGVYHRDYLLPEIDYIRLRAKNADDAEFKLGRVTMEFGNENVLRLFGRLEPTLKETKDKKLKNTSKYVILLNGYIFQAVGLNQPARGANIRDRRPKMDIDDDVENKENTKTESMRTYNNTEILGEQFGGLDKDGITIYIGNYVHSECIMKKLQDPNNHGWKKEFHTITYIDDEGIERADWEKRFPLKYVRSLEKWYEQHPDMGGRRTFFMEYYNKIISEKDYQVIFFKGEYRFQYGINWIVIKRYQEGEKDEDWINCFNVVSLDPAISTSQRSSDGVVSVTAFCSDTKRRVIDLSLGKFDIRDRYKDSSKEEEIKRTKFLARTVEDLAFVYRKGGVEETVRKILQYHANAYVTENAGQQLAWFNDIQDLLRKVGVSIPALPYHPTDDKTYKNDTGLLNYFAASQYEIKEDIPFRHQCVMQIQTFPDNKQDILDALHNAEKIGRIPLKVTPSDYGHQLVRGAVGEMEEIEEILNREDVEAFSVLPY